MQTGKRANSSPTRHFNRVLLGGPKLDRHCLRPPMRLPPLNYDNTGGGSPGYNEMLLNW